jgi:hypothetical protein
VDNRRHHVTIALVPGTFGEVVKLIGIHRAGLPIRRRNSARLSLSADRQLGDREMIKQHRLPNALVNRILKCGPCSISPVSPY